MNPFVSEFRTLSYIIKKSSSFLLFAHTRPDADSIGATLTLASFLKNKKVDIACFDPFPPHLSSLLQGTFFHPDQLNIEEYEVVIACDSVDRGFNRIFPKLLDNQISITIDHHPDISLESDLKIIDTSYSSTCEILYSFLEKTGIPPTKKMATALLAGIIFDTGNFQHACTTPRVMEIAGALMKKGASLAKIVDTIFVNKSVPALRLWGKAFEQSILNKKNGMIVTAITKKDVEECHASIEDIYNVASILSAVPEAKFSMVLSEQDNTIIRANLRSLEQHNVDVSAIAHRFGGGGHRLASGFEIPGKIAKTEEGWAVV